MDVSVDTKVNTDSIVLLGLMIVVSGAFIIMLSSFKKKAV